MSYREMARREQPVVEHVIVTRDRQLPVLLFMMLIVIGFGLYSYGEAHFECSRVTSGAPARCNGGTTALFRSHDLTEFVLEKGEVHVTSYKSGKKRSYVLLTPGGNLEGPGVDSDFADGARNAAERFLSHTEQVKSRTSQRAQLLTILSLVGSFSFFIIVQLTRGPRVIIIDPNERQIRCGRKKVLFSSIESVFVMPPPGKSVDWIVELQLENGRLELASGEGDSVTNAARVINRALEPRAS